MPTTPKGTVFYTLADLLSEDNSISFHVSEPERLVVRLSASADVVHRIPDFPSSVPEHNALFLYPAYKQKFLQTVESRPPSKRRERNLPPYEISRVFSVRQLSELQELISASVIPDLEKLKAFMAFSRQNIFSNPHIPTSLRIIQSATGLTKQSILNLVRQDPDKTFDVKDSDFIIPIREIDL